MSHKSWKLAYYEYFSCYGISVASFYTVALQTFLLYEWQQYARQVLLLERGSHSPRVVQKLRYVWRGVIAWGKALERLTIEAFVILKYSLFWLTHGNYIKMFSKVVFTYILLLLFIYKYLNMYWIILLKY